MIASASESLEYEFVATYDRKVHAAASAALAASKYVALRRLCCRVREGVVEISGTVGSFYLKQLAQAAVLQLNPATTVLNLVEVNGESSVLIATGCNPPNIDCGR